MTKANEFVAQEISRKIDKKLNSYWFRPGRGRLVSIDCISFHNDDPAPDALTKYKIKEVICDLLGWDIDHTRMRLHSKNHMIFCYVFRSIEKIEETNNGFTWYWVKS